MGKVDERLLELEKRIEEVREILNEACITSEDDKKTLFISQLLDDLIVEYFKVVEEDKILRYK
ncbi:aspartyl-phosphate phosphatase Spo0E family protein [Clostridium sp. UBA4548]|uniref:aspartyl-phosphate phosphatase Spo0E family protein n=1 Tax=Clostridium sp. UBA4548 TaxID=1946361 RepID=UPI0025C1A205|nr:aspartyl-phosphate phosphatase Spo0E family protein [Clostridium sp. UBA4548]